MGLARKIARDSAFTLLLPRICQPPRFVDTCIRIWQS
jgi:hypothetical protein